MSQYVPTISVDIIQNIVQSRKIRNMTVVYDNILRENPLVDVINNAIVNFVTKHPSFSTPEHVSKITSILLYKAIESQLECEAMERDIKL